MFITIASLIILFCVFLTLRDRIKYPRLSARFQKQTLKKIAELMALSEWDEAEKEVKFLIVKHKGGKEALLLLAQVLRGTKRFEEGVALVASASREYPEELLFRLEEGRLFLEMGSPNDAISSFRVCAPILRSESDYYDCALAHFQVGLHELCWQLISEWLPKSQNGKLLALGADCLFEKKQFREAIEFYKKAIECGANSHQVVTQLGHAFRKFGNLGAAEALFRQILDKDSSDVSATLGLGSCMQERGHYQKALLLYQSGNAWGKNDPRLLKQAGFCALITKKYYFSSLYFAEVIRSQSPNAQLLFYYAYSLEGEQKWQEAEQVYLQLIHSFPSDPRGFRALAWLYGVGLSTILSSEKGLGCAYVALKHNNDPVSWEIVSACEARKGNFQKAHQIQEYLFNIDTDKASRIRRQHAMRTLRKGVPLDDQQVLRSQVA